MIHGNDSIRVWMGSIQLNCLIRQDKESQKKEMRRNNLLIAIKWYGDLLKYNSDNSRVQEKLATSLSQLKGMML